MGRKKIIHREFEIHEYPRSARNVGKALVSEDFAEVRGDLFLRRVYVDGSGELVRYNDEAEMWAILVFPASVESGVEDKIHSSIRNNFDVGVCLEKYKNDKRVA